jgi:hypothetical protein
MTTINIPPFAKQAELVPDVASPQIQGHDIPNEPLLANLEVLVNEFLGNELRCPVLDELHPHLWLVAKKLGSHIDSLHEQVMKQRVLTVTEKSSLHMIWYYNIIYLKPMPHCLLNYNFWNTYLSPQQQQRSQQLQQQSQAQHYEIDLLSPTSRAALGFLRSYGFLIRYESDFLLAQQANLIPKHLTYTKFQLFIDPFRHLPDEAVAPRYHYGQIRLTRLNYAVRIFRPESTGHRFPWHYQEFYWQTGSYVERSVTPLLFIFASLSVVLSAMQVTLAAQGQGTWQEFSRASLGFSVAVIISNVVFVVLIFGFALGILVNQLLFAVSMKRKGKVVQSSNKTLSSSSA